MTQSFDTVEVTENGGKELRLTRKEFLALPLHERIRYLMQGKPKFFKGGEQVRSSEAVRSLATT